MPKGSGAAGAFKADEESVKETSEVARLEQEEEGARINISLPKSVLFRADRRVLSRKEKGESLNRSSYIAELIRKDTKGS